jgi:hypothetical protein
VARAKLKSTEHKHYNTCPDMAFNHPKHSLPLLTKTHQGLGTGGYSGGKDEEDHGSKPAQANSSQSSVSKIPNTKKG